LELGGQTGNVGKEIYGAGECLWLYLMFEALGQVKDRELMMVNLDLLDVSDVKQFPPRPLNFILYNPTAETRAATICDSCGARRARQPKRQRKTRPDKFDVPARSFLRLACRVRVGKLYESAAERFDCKSSTGGSGIERGVSFHAK